MSSSYSSLSSMWFDTVQDLLTIGQKVDSRVGGSSEILKWSATLSDIGQNFLLDEVRAPDPSYAAAEFLWYMSGKSETNMLERYAPSYARFAESDGKAYGAYGPRIMPLLQSVIYALQRYPDTRQAVLNFWRPSDIVNIHAVKDMPCTVCLHFIRRDNKLNCVCYMRSNDVWLGMPYDVFAFTMIQKLIADELDIGYGWYHHQVGSMHLYDKNREAAEKSRVNNWGVPVPKLHHNWDSRFRMPEIRDAVWVEEEMRCGKNYDLTPNGSAAMDMLICCKAKLMPDAPAFQRPTSEILDRAFIYKACSQSVKDKS